MKKTIKALILFSGGLDSILAAKILQEQEIKVTGLSFKSCFFDTKGARKAAQQLKIPLKIVDISQEHLELVKNPPHGYGKAANPCLDCHLLMLRKAKQIVEQENFDFVATGEVLGERPFSQNKKALLEIQEKSGLGKLLLRPLSAKLLPLTLPEKRAWVDRQQLLAIQGRSRKTQLALAQKYNLKFPQPAGGCILTEKEFSKKLFDLFEKWPDCKTKDIKLLFLGRHFWSNKTKIVLGKNKKENEKLEKLTKKNDFLIKPKNFPGPTALLRGKKINSKAIQKAKKLIFSYTKKLPLNITLPRKLIKING